MLPKYNDLGWLVILKGTNNGYYLLFFTISFLWKLTLKGDLVRTGHSKYGGLTKSYPENGNN